MKAKAKQHKQSRLDGDVAMFDDLKQRRTKKADKLTIFNTLKIETQHIKDNTEKNDKKTASSSSTSKKRRRRSAAEIDRKFKCSVKGCPKAYGSEGSLIHHQRVKHPELAQAEAQERKETQVGTFLLPLHNAPRNVAIRPATPMMTIAPDSSIMIRTQSSETISPTIFPPDLIPPFVNTSRCNMRSRSNSEPVTVNDSVSKPFHSIAAPKSNPIKQRARTPRPRRVSTLHSKTVISTTELLNIRPKSESFPELDSFQPFEALSIPVNQRSDSAASAHEPILPTTSVNFSNQQSFDWSIASISASGHSSSLPSDDQAIDSDILSVLAFDDTDDINNSSELDLNGESSLPRLYQSTRNDTNLVPVEMECFKIAGNSVLPTESSQMFVLNEPEAELNSNTFAALRDDWTNDAHLSTHLEKMSMAQIESSATINQQATVERLRSASDPIHVVNAPMTLEMTHFTMEDELTHRNEHNNPYLQWYGGSIMPGIANASTVNSNNPLYWQDVTATVAIDAKQPSSAALDELLQHDDAVDWKATGGLEDKTEISFALLDNEMSPTLL
ncbi:Zinc finger C2H2-type/integrase DNA-binding domain [Plasmopara halstedii]|uniref:Zinc finger C2H2-type/integrase DNA-binding domain n=1 Tax=Plasmopara halstedii TaxID=4781 RepID=A0A0P1A4F1_PLAHL|nr:Zinc finger C2H2-type/integrase DNA-binding domain [Plasmopara halstedii]CEG35392.1 Zinc finger C2H2-type/integrase DNA-binding domain [Plasmopara halstedii]|eukprot:XP_024571761.1 Zinc finger C2H2-type/integrase DNA-binding domain [Plasmopara halstedii]